MVERSHVRVITAVILFVGAAALVIWMGFHEDFTTVHIIGIVLLFVILAILLTRITGFLIAIRN